MRWILPIAVLLLAGIAEAAEVAGDGNGFRLSLAVKETEIAARQRLAVRVTLQNTGKQPVDVADPAFDDRKGPRWGFSQNNSYKRHLGIHFILTSADGQEVKWFEPLVRPCPDDMFGRPGIPSEDVLRKLLFRRERDTPVRVALERWVDEATADEGQRRRLKELIGPKKVSLAPGATLTTSAFEDRDECRKDSRPQPAEGFADLLGYRLRKGEYRLTAAYAYPVRRVLVKTPPVDITVR